MLTLHDPCHYDDSPMTLSGSNRPRISTQTSSGETEAQSSRRGTGQSGRNYDAGGRATAEEMASLSVDRIWRVFRSQSWAFWLLCFYFFLEYVRPQTIYPALDVLPWAQVTLVACTAAAVVEGKIRFSVPLAGLLGTFGVIVLLSVFVAYDVSAVFARPELFVNWLLVFFLTVSIVDDEERFFVFVLLYLLWNLKMSQHAARSWAGTGFAFRDWGVAGPSGWFRDSGEFAIQMAMFFPLSAYFLVHCWRKCGVIARLFLLAMPVTALMAVIASSSRGAYLGLAAAVLVLLAQSRSWRSAALVGVTCLGAALMVPGEQWDRFEQAGDDGTSQARLVYWSDGLEIMNRHPVLGVGYENWLSYYRDHYSAHSRFGALQEPHNIFIEAGAELGYSGLIAFILLISGTFWVNRRTRRLCGRLGPGGQFFERMAYGLDAALVAYLVAGFFVTVLYYPFFWVNLAMTAALHVAAQRRYRTSRQLDSAGRHVPEGRLRRVRSAVRRPA